MTIPSKDYIIAEFNRLQSMLGPGKVLTREQFRKGAAVSTSQVEHQFGSFAELKRAAGAAPTRADTKVLNAVAKIATVSRRDDLIAERDTYGEDYLRTDESRYKTMLVATDLHDKEIDPFFLRVFLDTAKRVQPETVVLGGDVFDLPEFGRYNVDPREWDAVGRIKFTHDNILGPLRENVPDAQIDLIEGNHECVTPDTEVLTDQGWMTAHDFYEAHTRLHAGDAPKIASFGDPEYKGDPRYLHYAQPIAVARQSSRKVVELTGLFKREKVTLNHNLVTYAGLQSVEHMMREGSLRGENLIQAIDKKTEDQDLELDWSIVRLAVWVSTTGSVMRDEEGVPYLLFNKVPRRMVRRLKSVARNCDLNWQIKNQSIELHGPKLQGLLEVITGDPRVEGRWAKVPDWMERLPCHYGMIVAEELTWASTLGFMSSRTNYYNGHGHETADAWQMFLVMRDVPCTVKKLPMGQYTLIFNPENVMERYRGNKIKVGKTELEQVISIQTVDGTLITRMDGCINFTGNCRLVKHLADFSPATRSILGDLHGMTIGDLFGLKKFEINYVAKADLKAYSAKEHDKELENNYRVYYDNVLVHHFPHARHMGMPGVNGHHHRHQVWPMFNLHQGAYTWHQLGAGHKRSASYCEGERWHTGFALIHVDTMTKSVNIEYIPITDIAVVGGKWYSREATELVT